VAPAFQPRHGRNKSTFVKPTAEVMRQFLSANNSIDTLKAQEETRKQKIAYMMDFYFKQA
jgi:hypothetical protein